MNPSYPVYVISKGRWESRQTAKALLAMRVPFQIVVEPQEYDQYAAVLDPALILVLPFSNLGQGSIPARNWVWDHAVALGAPRHWILDDNIRAFYRFNHNLKYYMDTGTGFKVIEDFCDRYTNLALAGMQYEMFVPRIERHKPLVFNTRIYSCILIQNDIPYRWRGRYNEDTDLSIRVLKDGWVTMLSYAFLAEKQMTMSMKGGNTDELYKDSGRLQMALSLQAQHPDCVTIRQKWGRWQHVVDYSRFKANQPILRDGALVQIEPNEYDMIFITPK